MTKISNQYSLTNILTADLANSRLGINNVSPTVALDVTGAGKFSSSVTAGGKIFTSTSVNDNIVEVINSDTTNGYGLYVRAGGTASGRYVARFKNGADADVMWLDKGGNVGIGNTSPGQKLTVTQTTNDSSSVGFFTSASTGTSYGPIILAGTNSSDATLRVYNQAGTLPYLFVRGDGNVGIGTSTPGEQLVLQRDTYPTVKFIENTNSFSGYLQYHSASNEFRLTTVTNRPLVFSTNDGERMRITASGNVSIGNTADDYKLEVRTNSTNYTAMFRNTSSTTSNGVYVYFDSSSSGTSQAFYRGESGAGVKALIYTNGSYGSATGTYGSIVSDLRLKENISEATSKLNDILKLRVVNFNITADLDKKKQIGFIAQEFKEVFPSLVFETDTREYDKNGNVIKGYENAMGLSVGMEFAILTKAIQELSAKVSLLENK